MPAAEPPTRADEALHLLHSCNTRQSFKSWTVVSGSEIEKLTVSMVPDARVCIDLLCALVRAFPQRARGPFLSAQALSLEFMHSFEPRAEGVPELSRPTRKRARGTDGPQSTEDQSAHLSALLESCLKMYNSSLVSVTRHAQGQDDRGPWHTFDVAFTDRLNLQSLVALYTHEHACYIKDMCIVNAEPVHIFIRPFASTERRVVHEWEFVPRYTSEGTFSVFRRRAVRMEQP